MDRDPLNHEQRIRALEDFVRGFKSSFGTGPSGSGSGAVTVPKTTVSTLQRKPNTFGIFNNNVTPETQVKMRDIIKDKMSNWRETEPEHASVVFVVAWTPGGRLDLTNYIQNREKFKGARVVGISLSVGNTTVIWPNDVPVSLSLEMLLADDFVTPDQQKYATKHAIERLAQDARASFQNLRPIGCAFCSNIAPPRQCANQCGALYCGQSCADADWIKGHAAACNRTF
jgi:hypothetical protein